MAVRPAKTQISLGIDKMALKSIFLETGVHPLQDGLYIVYIVLSVHVQCMCEMKSCLDTDGNFMQNECV